MARQTGHVPLVVGPEFGVDIGHSAEITAQREMGHAAGEIGAGQKVVPLHVRSILQHVDIGDRSVGDADDLEHDLHDRAITRSRCQTGRPLVRHRPGTHGPGQLAPADAGVGDTPFQRPAHGRLVDPVGRSESDAAGFDIVRSARIFPPESRIEKIGVVLIGRKDVLLADSQIGRHVEIVACPESGQQQNDQNEFNLFHGCLF